MGDGNCGLVLRKWAAHTATKRLTQTQQNIETLSIHLHDSGTRNGSCDGHGARAPNAPSLQVLQEVLLREGADDPNVLLAGDAEARVERAPGGLGAFPNGIRGQAHEIRDRAQVPPPVPARRWAPGRGPWLSQPESTDNPRQPRYKAHCPSGKTGRQGDGTARPEHRSGRRCPRGASSNAIRGLPWKMRCKQRTRASDEVANGLCRTGYKLYKCGCGITHAEAAWCVAVMHG